MKKLGCNVLISLIICNLIFGVPLMYAQETSRTGDSTGVKYSTRTNWGVYDVIYNTENKDYNVILGQAADGKGYVLKNDELSKQNIFANVVISKKATFFGDITGKRTLYYFSISIKPEAGKKSLHKTIWEREEAGSLLLVNSNGERHFFDVRVKPGSFVTVYAAGAVNRLVSEYNNKPNDFEVEKLISVLQNNEKLHAFIYGKNFDWSCEFDIIGNLPKIDENLTTTRNISEISTEKAAMSTGKKILVGIGAIALIAGTIFLGIQMADGADEMEATTQNFSQASPGIEGATPRSNDIIGNIAQKMKETRTPQPDSYWRKVIIEQFVINGTPVPPEMAESWAELIRQQAIQMAK